MPCTTSRWLSMDTYAISINQPPLYWICPSSLAPYRQLSYTLLFLVPDAHSFDCSSSSFIQSARPFGVLAAWARTATLFRQHLHSTNNKANLKVRCLLCWKVCLSKCADGFRECSNILFSFKYWQPCKYSLYLLQLFNENWQISC
jgi:hypothetical protein